MGLCNAGFGGLPELKDCLEKDKVCFGMVRFGFGTTERGGETVPLIVKHVFVHCMGSEVSAVQKGKLNAKLNLAQSLVKTRAKCNFVFSKEVSDPEDLNIEEMIKEIQRLSTT